MLDDGIRLCDLDVDGVWDFLVVGHVDFLNMWDWHWHLLDDGQSLLLMMMVMWLFVMDFVAEIVALVAVAVGAEVMIEQSTLVLLFAWLSSLDGLLLLLLSLLLCGDAKKHQHGNAEEHLKLAQWKILN
jgi:hypothetical protein